jgi:hypothetical protein
MADQPLSAPSAVLLQEIVWAVRTCCCNDVHQGLVERCTHSNISWFLSSALLFKHLTQLATLEAAIATSVDA